MTASPLRNRLLLVAAAILFSTGGAAIKAATLPRWEVACFRGGLAALGPAGARDRRRGHQSRDPHRLASGLLSRGRSRRGSAGGATRGAPRLELADRSGGRGVC